MCPPPVNHVQSPRLACFLHPLPTADLFLDDALRYDAFGELMEGVASSGAITASPSTFLAYLEASIFYLLSLCFVLGVAWHVGSRSSSPSANADGKLEGLGCTRPWLGRLLRRFFVRVRPPTGAHGAGVGGEGRALDVPAGKQRACCCCGGQAHLDHLMRVGLPNAELECQSHAARLPCPLTARPSQLRGDDRFAAVSWKRMLQLLVTVIRQYLPGECRGTFATCCLPAAVLRFATGVPTVVDTLPPAAAPYVCAQRTARRRGRAARRPPRPPAACSSA